MMRALFVLASLAGLSACATAPNGAPTFVEARAAPPVFVIGRPQTVRPTPARATPARGANPQQALAAANRAARRRPGPAGFVAATHFYAYESGAIFELYATPTRVSTILLEAGEALIDAAAGDTGAWSVATTLSGAGPEARTLILVKPKSARLRTNLVLVTDRRTYLIEAISIQGENYSAQIAWRYPEARAAPSAWNAAPAALNHSYRIRTIRGARPAWAPVRAYDDGYRTWIEFPENISASEMPPLFVRTREGAELVNYRVQRRRYMVDRLFDVAELRLGREAPVVVRIERRAAPRTARGARP